MAEFISFFFSNVFLLGATFIVCLFILDFMKRRKNGSHFPPGPRGLPFLGNILQVDFRNPTVTFNQVRKEFGDVFSLQYFWTKMVVVNGFEVVKEVLINKSKDSADRPRFPIYEPVGYAGDTKGIVLAQYGRSWKEQRRFTISTLRNFGMGKKSLEERVTEEAQALCSAFKSQKANLVARKIQLEKENIPASASLSIAPPVKPGAVVGQFPLHTYTSPLQQRVLHRRNYGAEENQPQRANTAVRTTSLSPICVVDRDECYAAPKQPGNPSPKISHQKYTNVSREKRAAQNARPRITRPANSTDAIPQVTPENREIEQLSEGMWSPIEPLNIPVCQTVQSADTALAGSSSVFAPVLPLKKRAVSRRRVGRKQKVAVHTPYTGRPSWDADHVKMFTDMSAQYAQSKLAQMELKSFCDTYERLLNACPTPDITEELRAFKLNHP
ncbi:uncharacterized protein [Ranitomeya imitator]|uniref:uncharacterized protein isoform X4 n=1 Tax=Ranitomeya imitator TaxID=111125 RepID=UPI0037E86032